jgi:hypothetical protein
MLLPQPAEPQRRSLCVTANALRVFATRKKFLRNFVGLTRSRAAKKVQSVLIKTRLLRA